jgi:hypothetical protein
VDALARARRLRLRTARRDLRLPLGCGRRATSTGCATAHDGFGIDREPMRDFDDGEKIGQWGLRRSILCLNADER